MTSFRVFVTAGLLVTGMIGASAVSAQPAAATSPATPAELVASYDNLANAILAVKKTEENLVRSILSTSYGHANAVVARARQALEAGDTKAASRALAELAAHVAQIGTEGDNAVAGIRKRLVEGGHHHNALGESQRIYDPGFVVVTKDAKRKLLAASREIAQMSRTPDAKGLHQAWEKVQAVWADLAKKK